MNENNPARSNAGRRITNIYIIIMLLLFPLFVGFYGYEKLTFSKFLFFVTATGLWLAALVLSAIREKRKLSPPALHHRIVIIFMAIVCISAVLSPYGGATLLGAGRYDGLVSQLLYGSIFIGISIYGKADARHFAFLGISAALCCAVAVVQLFDINIFGLFPVDYSYYDKGIRYSGEFMGTMGNTNVFSELLCLAIPAFFILPVLIPKRSYALFALPLFLAVFIALRAGVSGGLLALGICALVGAPIVFTDMEKLRRGLYMLCVCFLAAAAALAFTPSKAEGALSISLRFGPLPLLCLFLIPMSLALAAFLRRFSPSPEKLRRRLALTSAALILSALAAVYFAPVSQGTIYELSRVLHGQVDDSFGSSRILIWRECARAWLDAPLLGHGPDTVALTVDIDFSRYVEETGKTLRSSVDNAHNIYLAYLLNTGLAGFAAYTGLLVLALRRWLKNISDPMRCTLGLSLMCSAVQGFFALGLCLTAPLFWILLGLLFAENTEPENKLCTPGGNYE